MQPEEKGLLMKKAVQGFEKLEPKEQASLVSLTMNVAKSAQQQSGENAPPDERLQNLAALGQAASSNLRKEDVQELVQSSQDIAKNTMAEPTRLALVAKEL